MDVLEPVPVPGQRRHRTYDQRDKENGLDRRARCAVQLHQPGVPDRAVDDAQVHEVNEQRFLGNGAENVRQPADLAAEVGERGQDDQARPDAHHHLAGHEAAGAGTEQQRQARGRMAAATAPARRRARSARAGRTRDRSRRPTARRAGRGRRPRRMNPIHGKSGNCDPVAGEKYAAANAGSTRVQSNVQTNGVANTATAASAIVRT